MSDLISAKKTAWPEGVITRETPAYAAAISIEIWNSKTVVDMPALTGAVTLNFTAHANLEDGAEVTVNVDQDGTGRDVTWGANLVGDDLTGVANDKDVVVFQYSKSAGKFRMVSNTKIVDAA